MFILSFAPIFREVDQHVRRCVWISYSTILGLKISHFVTIHFLNLPGKWSTNYCKYICVLFFKRKLVYQVVTTIALLSVYHKFPKASPGANIFIKIRRDFYTELIWMRFKNHMAYIKDKNCVNLLNDCITGHPTTPFDKWEWEISGLLRSNIAYKPFHGM